VVAQVTLEVVELVDTGLVQELLVVALVLNPH
jgi:hypothetical protein